MKFRNGLIFIAICSTAPGADNPFTTELARLQQEQQRAAQAALEPVNRRYSDALQALLRRATTAGDLDSAMKIKAELQKLDETGKSAGNDTAIARFVGTWNLSYTNGATRVYAIEGDGTVRYVQDSGRTLDNKTGKITVEGRDFLIDFGEPSIERISRTGDTLNVEYFSPRAQYPKEKPVFRATGHKAKL